MISRYGEWDRKYSNKGLRVIGVHSGEFDYERDDAQVAAYVKKEGIPWPVVLDPEYGAWQVFGVNAWPTIFVIDRKGAIHSVYVGDDHASEIERDLKSLL